MIAQVKLRGSGFFLGLFFLVLGNKYEKKDVMRPFGKHWLNLDWSGSLNQCQVQGLDLV